MRGSAVLLKINIFLNHHPDHYKTLIDCMNNASFSVNDQKQSFYIILMFFLFIYFFCYKLYIMTNSSLQCKCDFFLNAKCHFAKLIPFGDFVQIEI